MTNYHLIIFLTNTALQLLIIKTMITETIKITTETIAIIKTETITMITAETIKTATIATLIRK